jgi:hypothetical protein
MAGHKISDVARSILDARIFDEKIYGDLIDKLKFISTHGISADTKVDITNRESDQNVTAVLGRLREHLKANCELQPSVIVGGNPAISAMRGHLLRSGRDPSETKLPLCYYAGLYPSSVSAMLESRAEKLPEGTMGAFKVVKSINDQPVTIGIETDSAKLMIIYGKGRSLTDLAPTGDFTDFIGKMNSVLENNKKGLIVLAITTPPLNKVESIPNVNNELELCRLMIEAVKERYGERVRVFVSTTHIHEDDENSARAILDFLTMKGIDIVSMNESEAKCLHTSFNEGKFKDIPLAYKVRQMPFRAIKLCHSANGVILDLGCVPERIITSQRFRENPAEFLEETLRLSADGATYAMDSMASLGRTANEAMIRIYSKHVDEREDAKFKVTFLNVDEPIPAGMIWESAAKIRHPMQAILGLGAIFDGLLLSFLMRD